VPTITKDECEKRRKALLTAIQDELDDDKDWLDSLFGWGPTVQEVVDGICCKDKENGCDCEELLQWWKDQGMSSLALKTISKPVTFHRIG
jgi:hypothetical protein